MPQHDTRTKQHWKKQKLKMIYIKGIDTQNIFEVCELTTNKNGIGTIMEKYFCCNAISIAEAKYFPEMYPKAIYNDKRLIGFLCISVLIQSRRQRQYADI